MVKYDDKFVEELRESIKALSSKPKRDMTIREVVELLRPELREKQKQGWTIKELAQFLTEKGTRVSATTLRDYLDDKKKRNTRNSSRTAKRKSNVAAVAERSTPPASDYAKPTDFTTVATATPTPRHAGFDEDV